MQFHDPQFSVAQTTLLTSVDGKTIDNWITHGHIAPGEGKGRERRFSLRQLLTIAILDRLRSNFNVQAATASFIAHRMAEDYEPQASGDLQSIWAGGAISATSYRPTYELLRGDDGELRAFERDDNPADGTMIIVPVGLMARGLFAKVKALREAEAE